MILNDFLSQAKIVTTSYTPNNKCICYTIQNYMVFIWPKVHSMGYHLDGSILGPKYILEEYGTIIAML